MDQTTTIQELKTIVQEFCDVREWAQFHNPKDLAIAISTEANELLEIFRFQTEEQIKTMLQDEKERQKISFELADTLYFVLRFAQMNKIDLATALKEKVKKNNERYTLSTSKGNNKKIKEVEK